MPQAPDPAVAVLARWAEPHRRYHDARHLVECLDAAVGLGAGRSELLALWFHDAVHTNTPGADEAASAELMHGLLHGVVPARDLAEATRLVLLTREHRPEPGDRAGAAVCDADLWVLGARPQRYAESVRDLRFESDLDAPSWARIRRRQLAARLARPIYHSPAGAGREPRARANLAAELESLEAAGQA